MSDRYTGVLSIPKKFIDADPELRRELEAWFGTPEEPHCDDIEETDEGIICYTDDDARYGCFEYLESLMEEKGVPFDRWTAPYFEDGFTMHFRPENGGSRAYCDSEDMQLVDAALLRKILDKPNLRAELEALIPAPIKSLKEYT